MKIMQVITLSEMGGAQSVVINIANHLCKDNSIIVVAGEGDGKMWDMLDSRIMKIKCKYLHRKLSFFNDIFTYFQFVLLYHKYKPDIIHLHSSKAGAIGRLAFPRKKTVYTVHGFDSIRLANRKFLLCERLLQYFCSAIVGVSLYDKNALEKEGITRNVYSIYNGIVKSDKNVDIPFDLPLKYKKNVMCIARIAKQKRFDLFLDTAKKLPEYAFIWIGNQCEVKDVPNNVFMLGNIVDAGRYCKYADVFMLPSNYEGLPIVIIEAMSYGKPIVASSVGGISEIVRDGINGFVVENDSDIMAQKICNILEDESVAKRLGENSLKIYYEELTADKMVNQYMNIYMKLKNV